ncbi:3-deoxy-D-manno-octulosonic acid transferase [Psychromonas sp. MB-3u-54]|uniref:lipid IV(A) 3-deoxy-D-manno-octulosonic acid transferase n=1 Tax=Psychromonas sp. MB-3u-54 TaxID=2058319 RepID=UPI000C327070|nr:lipid IV(A) 3-deoxy-D-manno-octulosonic acid transferase [Psychromonas sp. MB-3u-54]PKH01605.1 3-deoxy-D-manno-octulosonic acid transferase [Psychromonas sp. MB-3u-54]
MLIRFIYSALLILIAPFFLYKLYKRKEGKPSVGKRWKEHFGQTPKLNNQSVQPIWIHAVSVGEVIAVTALIRALKKQMPELLIVLTTTTSTGAEQAKKLIPLVEHRYMPLDFNFAVKGFLKKIKPRQLLIMETELWPNTLHNVAKKLIPIVIINARLSQRSADRYAKFPAIFNLLAGNISKILCQHQDDAKRFTELGINADKVHVTGSIKFDIEITPQVKNAARALRSELGTQHPIWIAASTHQGEDEQVLAAHKKVLQTFPNALLILVPRHPERFNEVLLLCQRNYFSVIKRSMKNKITANTQVYLADTMGEMLILLGAADICFMGGSLIGDKVGGHNLLEPAALGIPSLTGPSYFNFTEITKQLNNADATTIIHNANELAEQLISLFSNSEKLQQQGQSALKIVQQNQGAILKTLQQLQLT